MNSPECQFLQTFGQLLQLTACELKPVFRGQKPVFRKTSYIGMISEASLVRPPIFVIIRASTKIDLKTGFCGLKTGFSRNQRQMRDHVTDLSFSRTNEVF